IFYFWYMLGCALLGRRIVLWGYVDDPQARRRLALAFGGLGIVFGVPLSAVAAIRYYWGHLPTLSWCVSQFAALPMALLYLGVLMWLGDAGRLPVFGACVRAVGRMSLSNYLVQSLLCHAIFQVFGLYGLPFTVALLIACGIVLAQFLLSPLWLSVFQYGPVEWL